MMYVCVQYVCMCVYLLSLCVCGVHICVCVPARLLAIFMHKCRYMHVFMHTQTSVYLCVFV